MCGPVELGLRTNGRWHFGHDRHGQGNHDSLRRNTGQEQLAQRIDNIATKYIKKTTDIPPVLKYAMAMKPAGK